MQNKITRSFIVGDEWIFYKIYTGIKTVDLLLINHLNDVIKSLIKENIIDKWFFIRYTDPEHHLRLRLHLINKFSLTIVIDKINIELKPLLDMDLIWKIQLDTYNRELERYGFHTIDESETIFYYDSELIINSLAIIEESQNENLIWLFGLSIIDNLMNDFNFSIQEKKNLMENLKSTFGIEMGLDKNLKKQLSQKYQKNKIEIYNFFNSYDKDNFEVKSLKELIQNKSIKIKNEVKKIKENENEFYNIIASHIHMSMNRLFRNKNRETEFVCYQMLFFYYESTIARTKYNNA
jgi:thiopeptide-type bacteriocin biosynthesis protein